MKTVQKKTHKSKVYEYTEKHYQSFSRYSIRLLKNSSKVLRLLNFLDINISSRAKHASWRFLCKLKRFSEENAIQIYTMKDLYGNKSSF